MKKLLATVWLGMALLCGSMTAMAQPTTPAAAPAATAAAAPAAAPAAAEAAPAAEAAAARGYPEWVEVDAKALKGTYKAAPQRSELPSTINESLVVELYSK